MNKKIFNANDDNFSKKWLKMENIKTHKGIKISHSGHLIDEEYKQSK